MADVSTDEIVAAVRDLTSEDHLTEVDWKYILSEASLGSLTPSLVVEALTRGKEALTSSMIRAVIRESGRAGRPQGRLMTMYDNWHTHYTPWLVYTLAAISAIPGIIGGKALYYIMKAVPHTIDGMMNGSWTDVAKRITNITPERLDFQPLDEANSYYEKYIGLMASDPMAAMTEALVDIKIIQAAGAYLSFEAWKMLRDYVIPPITTYVSGGVAYRGMASQIPAIIGWGLRFTRHSQHSVLIIEHHDNIVRVLKAMAGLVSVAIGVKAAVEIKKRIIDEIPHADESGNMMGHLVNVSATIQEIIRGMKLEDPSAISPHLKDILGIDVGSAMWNNGLEGLLRGGGDKPLGVTEISSGTWLTNGWTEQPIQRAVVTYANLKPAPQDFHQRERYDGGRAYATMPPVGF
jgi:hypothetical protein